MIKYIIALITRTLHSNFLLVSVLLSIESFFFWLLLRGKRWGFVVKNCRRPFQTNWSLIWWEDLCFLTESQRYWAGKIQIWVLLPIFRGWNLGKMMVSYKKIGVQYPWRFSEKMLWNVTKILNRVICNILRFTAVVKPIKHPDAFVPFTKLNSAVL